MLGMCWNVLECVGMLGMCWNVRNVRNVLEC